MVPWCNTVLNALRTYSLEGQIINVVKVEGLESVHLISSSSSRDSTYKALDSEHASALIEKKSRMVVAF